MVLILSASFFIINFYADLRIRDQYYKNLGSKPRFGPSECAYSLKWIMRLIPLGC